MYKAYNKIKKCLINNFLNIKILIVFYEFFVDNCNTIEEVKQLRMQALDYMIMWWESLKDIDNLIQNWTYWIDIDAKNPKYYVKRGLAFANEQKNYRNWINLIRSKWIFLNFWCRLIKQKFSCSIMI